MENLKNVHEFPLTMVVRFEMKLRYLRTDERIVLLVNGSISVVRHEVLVDS